MGPCPKCGGNGKIPNGIYSNFEDKIFALLEDVNDVSLLQKISKTIERDLKRDISPKKIKKKLVKHFPKQKNKWSLIPETKQEAYEAIKILLAIITAAIAIGSCSKEHRETIINNIYLQERPAPPAYIPFDNHSEGINKPGIQLKI